MHFPAIFVVYSFHEFSSRKFYYDLTLFQFKSENRFTIISFEIGFLLNFTVIDYLFIFQLFILFQKTHNVYFKRSEMFKMKITVIFFFQNHSQLLLTESIFGVLTKIFLTLQEKWQIFNCLFIENPLVDTYSLFIFLKEYYLMRRCVGKQNT